MYVCFWEDFEIYMESQEEKLENLANFENVGKFPSAADVIKKLELTKEKLTRENKELHSRKGIKIYLNTKSISDNF